MYFSKQNFFKISENIKFKQNMLSLTIKQKLFLHLSHFLRNKGDTANFNLEKPNFCHLLNLYFSFHRLVNLLENYEFSGEIFAIYFIFLKGVVFLKILIW